MTFPQVSYSLAPAAAIPGMLRDSNQVEDILSKSATVELPFGRFASLVAANTVKLPAAAGDVTNLFGGFVVADTSRQSNSGSAAYAINEAAPILRRGRIWVETVDAAPLHGPVYVVTTAGANQGKVSDGTTGTLLPGARFVDITLAAPGLCCVEYEALGA